MILIWRLYRPRRYRYIAGPCDRRRGNIDTRNFRIFIDLDIIETRFAKIVLAVSTFKTSMGGPRSCHKFSGRCAQTGAELTEQSPTSGLRCRIVSSQLRRGSCKTEDYVGYPLRNWASPWSGVYCATSGRIRRQYRLWRFYHGVTAFLSPVRRRKRANFKILTCFFHPALFCRRRFVDQFAHFV